MRNVAVLALAAWLLASSTVEATDATTRPRLLPLPDVRQHTNYACGAGALQAVLAYYGVDVRGDTLMAKADPSNPSVYRIDIHLQGDKETVFFDA